MWRRSVSRWVSHSSQVLACERSQSWHEQLGLKALAFEHWTVLNQDEHICERAPLQGWPYSRLKFTLIGCQDWTKPSLATWIFSTCSGRWGLHLPGLHFTFIPLVGSGCPQLKTWCLQTELPTYAWIVGFMVGFISTVQSPGKPFGRPGKKS